MRNRLLIALFVCSFAAPAVAQERFEIAGQLSFIDSDLALQSETANDSSTAVRTGWLAALSYFASEDTSLVGEVAMQYGKQQAGAPPQPVPASLLTILGGARFGNRDGRIQYGVHILAGAATAKIESPGVTESETSIAVSLGGVLDVVFGKFGVRAVQGEILFTGAVRSQPLLRVSTGAFYRW
jgi:hypothetical protein